MACLPFSCHSLRKMSSSLGGKSEPAKQSLKKPKLSEGRFDVPEGSHLEKERLEEFSGDVNSVTKVKGPRTYSLRRLGTKRMLY
ncbi:succinate dehydrogenase assembly factor 4, mitochondrial-like [Tamandua tetradactyla]|uniref:succinate dehydrogenase assembly factor 4, mitochondrial-like n=1 Tax=Tamandua tetradactyla TaxID=48850 RepID=UPI0040544811